MYNREALAYHEAGHAVVQVLTGYLFSYVTIVADDKTFGHIKTNEGPLVMLLLNKHSRKRVIVALVHIIAISISAGDVAEEIFLGRRPAVRSWSDIANIETIARYRSKRPKSWAQRIKCRTRRLLVDPTHWGYVTTVANALLEKETLTGEEVHALLNLDYPSGNYCQMLDHWLRESKQLGKVDSLVRKA